MGKKNNDDALSSICDEVRTVLLQRIGGYAASADKLMCALGPSYFSAGLKEDESITVESFVMYLENMLEEIEIVRKINENEQNFGWDPEELLNGFRRDLYVLKNKYEFETLDECIKKLEKYIKQKGYSLTQNI